MKAEEFRSLSADELKSKIEELNQEMFNLRFQLHTGHLENSARITQVRKDIARAQSVLREKQ